MMMRLRSALIGVVAVALGVASSASWAQTAPPVTSFPAGFSQVGANATLSATAVSSRVELGWAALQPRPQSAPASILACNTGSATAFVKAGSSSVVATTGDFPVFAGTCGLVALNGQTYLAGITASGATSLLVMTGNGGSASASGSGGSSVTPTPVISRSLNATPRGGAVTLGGTAQTLMAANAARAAFSVQNPCTAAEQGIAVAESIYINLTNPATVSTNANLAVIPPCAEYALGLDVGVVSPELISVIAASTGHIWYAKEYQ